MPPYNPPPLSGHVWLRRREAHFYHYFSLITGYSLCGLKCLDLDIDDTQQPPELERRCRHCHLAHIAVTGGHPANPPTWSPVPWWIWRRSA